MDFLMCRHSQVKRFCFLWWTLVLISLLHGPSATSAPAAEPASTAASSVGESKNESTFIPSAYKTFAEWKTACDRLPFNRQLRRGVAPKELLPIKSFKEFDEVIEAFFADSKKGTLSQTNRWIGEMPLRAAFFNTDKVYFQKGIPFQPFAQKLLVPRDSEILFHGDLHGDVHSIVAWLDWLN